MPPVPKEERVRGLYVDAALEHAKVSAVDLATRLHVTPETVSRWRLGKVTLSRSRWIAVLAVLGLPVDWRPAAGFRSGPAKRGRPRSR